LGAKTGTARPRRRRRSKAWNLAMGIFFFIVGVIGVL